MNGGVGGIVGEALRAQGLPFVVVEENRDGSRNSASATFLRCTATRRQQACGVHLD
jgi:hypothetical protein